MKNGAPEGRVIGSCWRIDKGFLMNPVTRDQNAAARVNTKKTLKNKNAKYFDIIAISCRECEM